MVYVLAVQLVMQQLPWMSAVILLEEWHSIHDQWTVYAVYVMTGAGMDHHFAVPLLNGQNMCYSLHGEPYFACI